MAARRLVVVMLVLLAVSTLAAALLPQPERTETPPAQKQPKQKRPAQETPAAGEGGLLLEARMRVGRREPKTVRVQLGDQLQLAVAAPFGDDVEIPALGLTVPVTPYAPAIFDLLADSRGTFPVRTVDSGLLAGRLLVGRPGSGRCGAARPGALPGRESIPSCGPRDGQRSRAGGRSAPQP